MEMLRDRIKGMEQRMVEMIRHGNENVVIADRLHRFTRDMLLAPTGAGLPVTVQQALQREFLIPQVALRLWGLDEVYEGLPFTEAVSADTRSFTASLSQPYCGVNAGFEAASWLPDASTVQSLALIPLALDPARPFGLLVLGSPDPTRFTADMGTDFLSRLGENASAGLSRLLPAARG